MKQILEQGTVIEGEVRSPSQLPYPTPFLSLILTLPFPAESRP